MNRFNFCFLSIGLLFINLQNLVAQTKLKAIGSDTTYELINSVLAPGYNVVEVPDCGHTNVGRHIEEVYDEDLKTHVFKFIAHVDEDDDRCKTFDRQRTEIKTYDKSPDHLKAVLKEKVKYSWKFKLDAGFKPSAKFTHLHQLKSVDGPDDNMPLITLTARDATVDKLELRYADAQSQSTLTQIDLSEILGEWVSVVEDVTFEEKGRAKYHLVITRMSDSTVVLDYENNTIAMWKVDASFIRPKWGIYRSLLDKTKLRDEAVYFDDIAIEEVDGTLGLLAPDTLLFHVYPNPAQKTLNISNPNLKVSSYTILDIAGKEIVASTAFSTYINISMLPMGQYTLVLSSKNGVQLGSSVFLKR